MAILETLGYECHTEEDEIVVKRNGVVQEKLKAALVESKCRRVELDKKRIAQLRAILKKYRDMSTDRTELQEIMKSKFGVSSGVPISCKITLKLHMATPFPREKRYPASQNHTCKIFFSEK